MRPYDHRIEATVSLNAAERHRTGEGRKDDLALSGLTPEEVAEDLGFEPRRLRAAPTSDPAGDPVDVWQLRDHLEQAARDAGREPVAHTVLTEEARLLARRWFPLREAPRRSDRQ